MGLLDMGIFLCETSIDLNTFSAEDARKRSEKIVTDYSKNQLDDVLKDIVEFSGKGRKKVSIYNKELLPNVILELEKRRFKVSKDEIWESVGNWKYDINW